MKTKSEWSSTRRPWEVMCSVLGLLGLLTSGAGIYGRAYSTPAAGAWFALGISAAIAIGGLVALVIRRERRNRGLLLNRELRPGASFAAIACLLIGAFAATIWPVAMRFAWTTSLFGLVCIAGAVWLGLRLARNGLPAPFRRAQRLHADGETDEALRVLDELADHLPGFFGADQLRAQIRRERQEYAAALELSDHLISRCPELYYGYAERGLTLLAQGQADQAMDSLAGGVAVAPYLPEAHYNLGMAAAEAGEPERTAEAMSAALRLGLRDQVTELIARYQLHQALTTLGRHEDAARELRRLRRMGRTLGEWRASLNEGDIPRHLRRADMALSARIERIMHS